MDNIKVVAVDAMGGDNAPVEIVKGCVEAVKEREDIKVLLVGLADVVQAELTKYTYPTDRIEVVPASQVIETAEPPVMAIQKERFVDRCGIKTGQGRQGGWLCFRRQFRGGLSGRTSDRW